MARAAESEFSFRAFIRVKNAPDGLDERWFPNDNETLVRHPLTGRHRAIAPPAGRSRERGAMREAMSRRCLLR